MAYDPGQPGPITSMEYYSLDPISVRRYGGDAYVNGGENSQFGAPAMCQALFQEFHQYSLIYISQKPYELISWLHEKDEETETLTA